MTLQAAARARYATRMPRALLCLVLAIALATLPACKPANTGVRGAYATTISPTGGPTTASMQIAKDWRAKKITIDECIDYGFQLLDGVKNGTPVDGVVPKSMDATAFASAVLDATKILVRELPAGADTEIFWQRLGGLAFAASEEARAAGRGPEALALVLGGAARWQTESYWHLHPTHDGLVSWLLAESGNKAEALARLRSRPGLDGFALKTYKGLGGGEP